MSRSARRPLLALGGAVAAVALVLGGLWITRGDTTEKGPVTSRNHAGTASTTSPRETSPRETSAVGETPAAITGGPVATDEPVATRGGAVTVVVTQAGWTTEGTSVEVAGFVGGVIEDGGTCRVTLTRGGESLTAEAVGVADHSTTICPGVELGDPDMTTGLWRAVLSYESATATGKSEPVEVLVPTQ
jgi:hypothetical protein